MAEPQPSNIHEGIDAEDDAPPPPAAAEDRKAAAAMSSLENRHNDDEDEATQKLNKTVDQAASSAAINRLELQDPSKSKDKAKSAAEVKRDEKKATEIEEKAKRAKVKVDQADVTLLVEELDLNKVKATELLKANEGDAVKAMRAFVTVPI